MTAQEALTEMVARIRREFDPDRIILFGSYARGEAGCDSDIDLLVVLPHVEHKVRQASSILRSLSDVAFPKDILVTSAEEIAARGTLVGSVLLPALREGRTVYTREGADAGQC